MVSSRRFAGHVIMISVMGCVMGATAGVAHADAVHDALHGGVGNGTIDEGRAELRRLHESDPENERITFALGLAEFLRTNERLVQDLAGIGFGAPLRDVGIWPAMRMIPTADDPAAVRYEDLAPVVGRWLTGLNSADRTLAGIEGADFELLVHPMQFRIDLDNDQAATDRSTLGRLIHPMSGASRRAQPTIDPDLRVDLDRADVEWLRGYCNLLSAFGQFMLAHDGRSLFNGVAHVFFARPDTPMGRMDGLGSMFAFAGNEQRQIGYADLIAFVHLIRLPVDEPERLEAVHEHLLATIQHSRAMWAAVYEEDDHAYEWIPAPSQLGALPDVDMTEERIDAWLATLDELEAVLGGTRLAPFWRGGDRGVNVRRALLESDHFDLVLWMQGSAAMPYLEEGEITDTVRWRDLEDAFEGDLIAYLFYIN